MEKQMSLEQLLSAKAELDGRIAQIQADEKANAICAIRTLMEQHGLTMQDIGIGNSRKGRKLGPVAPKWIDSMSGATWSGRGRPPKWFIAGTAVIAE